MVQLDDGPYIVGRLVRDIRALIGDRVTAEFAEVRGAPQLRWRPAQHADKRGNDGKA
jgi:uncharacterized OB-fold protein